MCVLSTDARRVLASPFHVLPIKLQSSSSPPLSYRNHVVSFYRQENQYLFSMIALLERSCDIFVHNIFLKIYYDYYTTLDNCHFLFRSCRLIYFFTRNVVQKAYYGTRMIHQPIAANLLRAIWHSWKNYSFQSQSK